MDIKNSIMSPIGKYPNEKKASKKIWYYKLFETMYNKLNFRYRTI